MTTFFGEADTGAAIVARRSRAAARGPAGSCAILVPCGRPPPGTGWPRPGAPRRRRPPSPPSRGRRSVLLVTVDTLRADRLGAYGDAAARTPHLDALAAQGVALRARVHARADHAARAHVAVDRPRSRPRTACAATAPSRSRPGTPTLAEALRAPRPRHGRLRGRLPALAPVRPGPRLRPLRRPHGQGLRRPLRATRSAAPTTWWRRRARGWPPTPAPSSSWVHLFDPHAPYDPPATPSAAPTRTAARSRPTMPRSRACSRRGTRGRSRRLVAVTADHGEAFGEHGEESHSLFVYDMTLRVPLVRARARGRRPAAAEPSPVSLADLAATLLALAGAPGALPGANLARSRGARGRSTPRRSRRASTSDGATCARREGGTSSSARRGRSSTTWWPIPRRPATSRRREPATVTRLAAALDAMLAAAGERRARRAADPETAERLRALGYVQGPGGGRHRRRPQGQGGGRVSDRARGGPVRRPRGGHRRLSRDRGPRPRRTRS